MAEAYAETHTGRQMDIANCISHESPPQTVLICTLKGKEGVGEGAKKEATGRGE